jgi:hypothetical protein
MVKQSPCLIKHNAMKAMNAYGGVKDQANEFPTSAVDEGDYPHITLANVNLSLSLTKH